MADIDYTDRQEKIQKILRDKSLTEEEKEEYIKYIFLQYPQENSNEEAANYEKFILIDKINKDTLFLSSEEDVFAYISDKEITIDDVVIYIKQTVRLCFENSD